MMKMFLSANSSSLYLTSAGEKVSIWYYSSLITSSSRCFSHILIIFIGFKTIWMTSRYFNRIKSTLVSLTPNAPVDEEVDNELREADDEGGDVWVCRRVKHAIRAVILSMDMNIIVNTSRNLSNKIRRQ